MIPQALAVGTPVVGTTVGGTPEVVRDGETAGSCRPPTPPPWPRHRRSPHRSGAGAGARRSRPGRGARPALHGGVDDAHRLGVRGGGAGRAALGAARDASALCYDPAHASGHSRPRSLAGDRGPVLRDAPGRSRRRRHQARAARPRGRPALLARLGDERRLRRHQPQQRSIAVELQHPDGARLAAALAQRADVIVENFLPGVAERLGLGYAAIRAVNPSVVYASVTGFGQTGPYAKRPGYNTIAQGMSGLMASPGCRGIRHQGGGSVSAWRRTMCLARKRAPLPPLPTGVGRTSTSIVAATRPCCRIRRALIRSGVRPKRVGNRNANLTPAEAYPTKDGMIQVVMMNPDQYDRFCRALGDDALATDPRFATNDARLANYDEFRARVERTLAAVTTAEWQERFERAQIAAGPSTSSTRSSATLSQALGLVTEVEQPAYARCACWASPCARPPPRRPSAVRRRSSASTPPRSSARSASSPGDRPPRRAPAPSRLLTRVPRARPDRGWAELDGGGSAPPPSRR